ncbi:hypothetical protein WICPIJ_004193 [Wickerhamomyces pijperi]|uniref:Uncharacterized protein n=1 Tax=Wickerhamomyces pijperi TaxID=599730 RepID=A0A9P8Q866_WICPI|nr:hypothetical protein WICPIJ_004193 [Wickerhamomyces pijperi]
MDTSIREKASLHSFSTLLTTSICPQLCAVQSFDFTKRAKYSNHDIPPALVNGSTFCSKCNTLLIPGVTLKMRIVRSLPKKKKDTPNPNQRNLSTVLSKMNLKVPSQKLSSKSKQKEQKVTMLNYKCLSCGKSKVIDCYTAVPASAKSAQGSAQGINNSSSSPNNNNSQVTKTKKKKKNNLLSLLDAKKKQEEKNDKRGGILSFEDFLKH